MVPQTLEFIAEQYEIRRGRLQHITRPPPEIIRKEITSEDGNFCIKLYDQLNTNDDPEDVINGVLSILESLSLCVDSPLGCPKIRFVSHQHGKLLVANRRPFGRGVGFEIEERGKASRKLDQDIDFYADTSDSNLAVGRRHYLTGMQLLALEDQVAGLVDAAFMQFYQGCEALCRDPRGALKGSQRFIASLNQPDVRELQIIAHQVWKVRNKYFGHGDVSSNLAANLDRDSVEAVAKQVLVVRYLCRRLIDASAPSGISLAREIGFFIKNYSGDFTGEITSLETNFRVPFDERESKIFNSNEEDTYVIK